MALSSGGGEEQLTLRCCVNPIFFLFDGGGKCGIHRYEIIIITSQTGTHRCFGMYLVYVRSAKLTDYI